MKEINSISNNLILKVRKLKDKAFRYESKEFIVEGANIIKDLPKDISVCSLFVEKSKTAEYSSILDKFDQSIIYVVSDKVMNVLSDTKTPCGILCTCLMDNKNFDLKSVVVLDGVSDPGNMGTIIRTCVACGIQSIIAINTVDAYSMKVVRSSMGGIFRVNIINATYEDALNLIKNHEIISLDMNGENLYEVQEIKNPFALVVGNEAHGVSSIMKKACTKLVSLPMKGDIESLNAAVSLSVALYHVTNANILK